MRNRSTRWAARTARAQAGHIDRLRDALDLLGERLRDAAARAVGDGVAGAAQDAVRSLMGDELLPHTAVGDRPFDHRPAAAWRDQHDDPWADDPDDYYEARSYAGRDEQGAAAAPEPSPEAVGRRWGLALAVGCQAAAWWLRRKAGRLAALEAAGVGLASALVAYVAAPALAAGAGLAGSAPQRAALTDAARCGAAALYGAAARRSRQGADAAVLIELPLPVNRKPRPLDGAVPRSRRRGGTITQRRPQPRE